ncbi:MAG: hypothetical protein ACFFD1_08540 [Candidatus Thorarchaeota archaeon]
MITAQTTLAPTKDGFNAKRLKKTANKKKKEVGQFTFRFAKYSGTPTQINFSI